MDLQSQFIYFFISWTSERPLMYILTEHFVNNDSKFNLVQLSRTQVHNVRRKERNIEGHANNAIYFSVSYRSKSDPAQNRNQSRANCIPYAMEEGEGY